jgi:predicted transcriptional regulator
MSRNARVAVRVEPEVAEGLDRLAAAENRSRESFLRQRFWQLVRLQSSGPEAV